MIEGVFHLMDNAARVIGWCIIAFGIIWIVGHVLQDRQNTKAYMADREAELAFLGDLQNNHPEMYARFRVAKDKHFAKEVHWHQIAREAGFPLPR